MYGLLADITAWTHGGFVLFVVVGELLILAGWVAGWRWTRRPWFRWIHLAAIAFVVSEAWLGVQCPLTVLENALRAEAGGGRYEAGFLAHWVHAWLFYRAPEWVFTAAYSGFALLVVATFVFYPPRKSTE